MMVIFLTGLVSLILMRTLRNDYAKYSKDQEIDELDIELDESGWKQVSTLQAAAHPTPTRAGRCTEMSSARLATC